MINHQHTELEQEEEVVLDPESDDSEASDILELIERESSKGVEPEVITEQPAVAEKAPAEDFALESLYFRSFGERPLLKRDEEIALAKRLDQLAKTTDRTTTSLVAQAVEELLALEEWHVQAIQEGLAAADRGEVVSHEEACAALDRWRTRAG